MRYLFATLSLYVFWLVLSGHYTVLLLALGAVSSLLVAGLLRRMDRVDGMDFSPRPSLGLVAYGVWLLWNVVKSNVDVARRIWDPALPVDPGWTRLPVGLSTPLEKTLYANSITLTPGTLTADVHDDQFLVHGLSSRELEALHGGEMERRIRRLRI